jgi:hypothetical protein
MPNLIDLKRTPSDKKENETMLYSDVESEDYSWGLQLDLGNDELDKLGVDQLNVGDEFEITALVRVKSFSENQTEGDGKNRNAGLLVKAIEMPGESKSAAEKLYGDDNAK